MFQNFSRIYVLAFTLIFINPTAVGDTKASIELGQDGHTNPVQNTMPDTQKEKPRGQLLYENHCGACHETSVHARNPRKASTTSDIRQWVSRWQKELKLNWPAADIDEVTKYLNSRYYHYSN